MAAAQADAAVSWTRNEVAARVAQDIPEGWYVNLGIGIPTLVANYVAADREVIFHSENGILGVGPAPSEAEIDPFLINAGKQPVTLRPGGSYFNQAESFAMIRGGHLDLCVLGAYEVSSQGDLANWAVSGDDAAPAVGGAMDLAAGARRLWVIMDHETKAGAAKLVAACRYPLTARSVVSRVYTSLAVLDVGKDGFVAIDIVPGLSLEELRRRTGAPVVCDPALQRHVVA